MIKNIKFKDIEYSVKVFNYLNGRIGLKFTEINKINFFSGTVNIESVKIMPFELIIKSHDFNKGLLNLLIKEKIISKQYKNIPLGYNKVYICKLING